MVNTSLPFLSFALLLGFMGAATLGDTNQHAKSVLVPPSAPNASSDVEGVYLEAWPNIPTRSNRKYNKDSTANQHHVRPQKTTSYPKPKLDLSPQFSRPDFGRTSELAVKDATVRMDREVPLRQPVSISSGLKNHPVEYAHEDFLARHRGVARKRKAVSVTTRRHGAPFATLTVRYVRDSDVTDEVLATETTHSPTRDVTDAVPKTTTSRVVSAPRVGLNYRAIRERIDSHNYEVAALEQQLEDSDSWNAASLEAVVAEIAEVRRNQEFWSLYWRLLSPRKRSQFGNPLSLDNVLNKLQERIFEATVEADMLGGPGGHRKSDTKRRLKALEQQARVWKQSAQ